jgi:phage-related holin
MNLWSTAFNLKNIFSKEMYFAGGISVPVSYIIQQLYGPSKINLLWAAILLLVTAFDWGSGISAAKKDGVYTSEYGRMGLIRTAVILLFPVLANLFDKVLGTPGFFYYFFVGGIIYHTWMSMTANFARAGWDKWIPNWALDMVASEIQAKTQRAFERQQQLQLNQPKQENSQNQKTTDIQ